MKLIEYLSERIEEEIEDANGYALKALELKGERPELAETLLSISKQECEHMNRLHEQVAKIIIEYRNKNGEPPADMLAIYEYLHKKHIAKYTEVKRVQDMFNGR